MNVNFISCQDVKTSSLPIYIRSAIVIHLNVLCKTESPSS